MTFIQGKTSFRSNFWVPVSSDTMESEGRQMKQCWIQYIGRKNPPVTSASVVPVTLLVMYCSVLILPSRSSTLWSDYDEPKTGRKTKRHDGSASTYWDRRIEKGRIERANERERESSQGQVSVAVWLRGGSRRPWPGPPPPSDYVILVILPPLVVQ
jgi:hypothetical protein